MPPCCCTCCFSWPRAWLSAPASACPPPRRWARKAITIGARICSSWLVRPLSSWVAWARPVSTLCWLPPKMWPRMPAPSLAALPPPPPSTEPSTLPRSSPLWLFCSAPSSACAPCGCEALLPSAPISTGSAALIAPEAWVSLMPSCCDTCCSGAPCSLARSSSVRLICGILDWGWACRRYDADR